MKRFGFILTTMLLLVILFGLLAVGINLSQQNKAYAQETQEKETPEENPTLTPNETSTEAPNKTPDIKETTKPAEIPGEIPATKPIEKPIETPTTEITKETSDELKDLTIEGPDEITLKIGDVWSGTGYFLKKGSEKYEYFDVKYKDSEIFPKWIKIATSDDNSKLSIGLGDSVDLRVPKDAFSCQLVIEGKDQANTTVSQTVKIKVLDSSGEEITNPKEKMPQPPDEKKTTKTTKKKEASKNSPKSNMTKPTIIKINGIDYARKDIDKLEKENKKFLETIKADFNVTPRNQEIKLSQKHPNKIELYVKGLVNIKTIANDYQNKTNDKVTTLQLLQKHRTDFTDTFNELS